MFSHTNKIAATVTLLAGMAWAGSAAAAAITGTFTLRADGFTPGFAPGEQIAEATFTTEDVDPSAGNLFTTEFANVVSGTPFIFQAVRLAEIELTDVFGNTFIGGSSVANSDFSSGQPYAILDANPNGQVDFILGTAEKTILTSGPMGGPTGLQLATLQLTFDEATGSQGTYSISGTDIDFTTFSATSYTASGNQYVPEPGIVALLSAGLLAVGFAGRRRKKA